MNASCGLQLQSTILALKICHRRRHNKWTGCTTLCPLGCSLSSQALQYQGAEHCSGAAGRNELQEETPCCIELTMQICPGWLSFPLLSTGTVAQFCKESAPILFWFEITPGLFCSALWLWLCLYLQCLTLCSHIEADPTLVHSETSKVNPCKELRGEGSPCKGLMFQSCVCD